MLRATSNASVRNFLVIGPVKRLQAIQSCLPSFIYCRTPGDFQIATITRTPNTYKYENPKERETCPKIPPPPPPRKKRSKLLWGTLALLALTGGFVVYAKDSPELRDWLTLNAPWFDDVIAVLYQENMSYKEFADECIADAKKYFTGQNKPKQCSIEGGPVNDVPEKPKEEEPKEEDEDSVAVCVPEPPPVVTKNICDIEKCMNEFSLCALNNYFTAKAACAVYNSLMENTMANFTFDGMKDLHEAKKERNELVKVSLSNASGCIEQLDELVRYIDCGVVLATKEQIKHTKLMHKDMHVKIKIAYTEYLWEDDKSNALDMQLKLVEDLVEKYVAENEDMFTGLKYTSKNPQLTGDMDVFLYNCSRYIQYLKERVKDNADRMSSRLTRAFDELPGDPKAKQDQLKQVLAKKKEESAKELQAREDGLKVANENHLKNSLKLLQEKHNTTLATQLARIQKEVLEKFNKMVADRVDAEKKVFDDQLKEMSMKIEAVEEKLDERLKAEKETRRSQELWAAGASLLAATKKGEPFVKVDKEIKAIEKASGDDDQLVMTVLNAIPTSVREKGIVPESVLQSSFHSMEKTARSVALVEQEGAPMPVYMLSWLQGLLLFLKVSGIPQKEFEKPPTVVPAHLDTFDLLQRARFWVERGNLALAIRYVESLKGASRAAASSWFEAARVHLEVRQAAEAVLAHAAALGLRYI